MDRPHATDHSALAGPGRLVWPDLLKAVAMAWIFLNHVVEPLFGYPLIANPAPGWPPFADRLEQLRPLTGYGVATVPVNAARYLGWFGDQGVQLFVILSGFSLAWSAIHKFGYAALPMGEFYRRRLLRIYPMWIVAHIGLGLAMAATGMGSSTSLRSWLLSIAGVRFLPSLFYAITPAWWYIGLLLQLYLVFPLLWRGLLRLGSMRFFAVCCVVGFAARAAGMIVLEDAMDAWLRGSVFLTRLPEFAFGMLFAALAHRGSGHVPLLKLAPATLGLILVAYAGGTVLSLTWAGMVVAPLLVGVSAFLLLYGLVKPRTGIGSPWACAIAWIGRHSYSLFLVHHPVIQLVIGSEPLPAMPDHLGVRIGICVVGTLMTALVLEFVAETVPAYAVRACRRLGARRTLAAAGAGLGLLVAGFLAADETVRRYDPQEVFGWGERPSLQSDEAFGWRLKGSTETRLRWESYDYIVTANRLGFPGPDYPEERSEGSIRIMTLGDAFTSAEGVDTEAAWPRLLERNLAERLPDRRIEVLNFAITGHGPNQYAAIADAYVPRFRPDVVIVGFFVNEYDDVLRSDRAFRRSIGFDRVAPDSWVSRLTGAHLLAWSRMHVSRWLNETVRGRPWPHGYFLAQLAPLERENAKVTGAGRDRVKARLSQIAEACRHVEATLIVMMIPAPPQICDARDLAYFPRHVELDDPHRFDVDQPQRVTRELCAGLGIPTYDLRPLLTSLSECPYQPRNLHWTERGHAAVAASMAEVLLAAPMFNVPSSRSAP